MNIEELLSLPQDKWLEELKVDPVKRDISKNIEYYNGDHPILKDLSRADYQSGKEGDEDRKTITRSRKILNYPQQIVETAVGMCLGEAVSLILNDGNETLFNEFVDQWRNKTRLDSFSKVLARSLLVESKVAEVFFIDQDDPDKDIKAMLLSKETGDDIWAHFNDERKMDALTRVFTKRAVVDGEAEDVEVTQIWTAEKLYQLENEKWDETPNPYEKLQIVYYDQKVSEFAVVADLINTQELVRSQASDANKRVGNVNIVIDGEINGTPDAADDVKVWNTIPTRDPASGATVKSDVKYLQMQGANENINKEIEMDKQDMYKLSWPDLSFLRESIKTGALSGTAIKLMFVDAFVKIGNKRTIFEDFSRRVSIMKRMMTKSRSGNYDELNISVQFNSILPENLQEVAETLAIAVQNEFTSKEHATGSFSANDGDPDVLDQIRSEQALELGGSA